jgi:hypothetical protein
LVDGIGGVVAHEGVRIGQRVGERGQGGRRLPSEDGQRLDGTKAERYACAGRGKTAREGGNSKMGRESRPAERLGRDGGNLWGGGVTAALDDYLGVKYPGLGPCT